MPLIVLKASVATDASGVRVEVPVLLSEEGVVQSALDYCLARSHDRSLMWMRKLVRAIQLFVAFAFANPGLSEPRTLFNAFARRLYTGTYQVETGVDESGLGWKPLSPVSASNTLNAITEFFDWLGETKPEKSNVNPKYLAGTFDRRIDEAAYQHRRERALLGHSWDPSNTIATPSQRLVRPARASKVEPNSPPAFPDDRLMDLLFEGFKVGRRHDLRGMLITLLLNGAGFRASEPFHLFVGDVISDPIAPASALVMIGHPSQGAAPAGWRGGSQGDRNANRLSYLAECWQLIPRNKTISARHAGWKGGVHESNRGKLSLRGYWFLPALGELFMKLWRAYLFDLSTIKRKHPFAFVNIRREPIGIPYTLAQFNKAHARAVTRIGLTVSKEEGTSLHGHRHAYGQRLSSAGLDPLFIRKAMHHSSMSSQEVYTQPSHSDVFRQLQEAARQLSLLTSQIELRTDSFTED